MVTLVLPTRAHEIPRSRDISQSMETPSIYVMNAQASPHQDMLARITRQITVTEDLGAVLNSVVAALVEQTGMAFARVWLYVADHQCDWCRTHARPSNALVPPGETALHLCAAAGALADLDKPNHMLPLTA